ncbi:MAG: aminotransferase, partial [Hyphomonas sp.]|nr:aminotransferase [Hyphomonas sp.]
MKLTRRLVMKGAAATAASFNVAAAYAGPVPLSEGESPEINLAQDEIYWQKIAAQYDVTPDIVNFENGYWGLMARPVMEAFFRHTERVNRENSSYARQNFYKDLQPIQQRLAAMLGAGEDEIALTRGATEALQALIGGY